MESAVCKENDGQDKVFRRQFHNSQEILIDWNKTIPTEKWKDVRKHFLGKELVAAKI